MKRNILITAVLMSIGLSFLGCKSNASTDTVSIPSDFKSAKESDLVVNTEVKVQEEKNYSPFTGEEVSKETLNSVSFMAVIENSRDARPQSGLSEADIVYETMAEGGIPRFIALFHKNSPKEIGPIRSMRPYFVNISKEYNLPFGHCGGSEEALMAIKNENLMSLNEITNSSYYWRDNSRKAPHNLYTSSSKLRELITTKGYISENTYKPVFNKDYWTNSRLPEAANVNMKVNRYYNTDYEYKDGHYYKSMDKAQSIDKANNLPIAVSNIVIQLTEIRLQPDGSHIDIDLVGSGNGYIASNGKLAKMNWKKDSISAPTVITDETGTVLTLSPGKTWWHIVDKNCIIEFK